LRSALSSFCRCRTLSGVAFNGIMFRLDSVLLTSCIDECEVEHAQGPGLARILLKFAPESMGVRLVQAMGVGGQCLAFDSSILSFVNSQLLL
jgi:hypothetical protein